MWCSLQVLTQIGIRKRPRAENPQNSGIVSVLCLGVAPRPMTQADKEEEQEEEGGGAEGCLR